MAMVVGTIGVASTIAHHSKIRLGEEVIALCNLRKPPVYAIAQEAATVSLVRAINLIPKRKIQIQEHLLEGANAD
ncbi:MAG: hypothetical protein R3D26_03010 [Cyanobacteriota/Melainabacteria group bacterium]